MNFKCSYSYGYSLRCKSSINVCIMSNIGITQKILTYDYNKVYSSLAYIMHTSSFQSILWCSFISHMDSLCGFRKVLFLFYLGLHCFLFGLEFL